MLSVIANLSICGGLIGTLVFAPPILFLAGMSCGNAKTDSQADITFFSMVALGGAVAFTTCWGGSYIGLTAIQYVLRALVL